jgi:hypothetical protein
LAPWSEEELNTGVRVFSVDERDGIYVNLTGTSRAGAPAATLGVIVGAGEQIWFFKLHGDKELVSREQTNFESLVAATKFSSSEEAVDE